MKSCLTFATALWVVVPFLCPTPAHAQFDGHQTEGDFGLMSGSQPPPGFYLAAPICVRYDADTLRNSAGDPASLDPNRRGSVTVNGYALGWAGPSEETFGPGLDDEWALEASYRMQMPPNATVMPDVQLVIDPARNPDTSTAWVFGLRVRWDL